MTVICINNKNIFTKETQPLTINKKYKVCLSNFRDGCPSFFLFNDEGLWNHYPPHWFEAISQE